MTQPSINSKTDLTDAITLYIVEIVVTRRLELGMLLLLPI